MNFIETKLNIISLEQDKNNDVVDISINDIIDDEYDADTDGSNNDDDAIKKFHKKLKIIFIPICKLYNDIKDENKEWNENVRNFIEFHEDILDSMDDYETDEMVCEHGFHYFVGNMCADIDEDEFDGPNDLSVEEWEKIDDIILYYYKKE